MVAYSYKRRFVTPIQIGLGLPIRPEDVDDEAATSLLPKLQTIRADRKRHARPGEEIQHYCGMRTAGCFLIGRARCASAESIAMYINAGRVIIGLKPSDATCINKAKALDDFAHSDGFGDWADMREFWRSEHPDVVDLFVGVIIKWEPLT